jgi:hypothetical protein
VPRWFRIPSTIIPFVIHLFEVKRWDEDRILALTQSLPFLSLSCNLIIICLCIQLLKMNLFVYTITSNEFVCVHNYYRVSDTRKEEQIPDRIINSCVLCTIKPNLDSRNNNQEHQNTASSVRPFFAHSLHLFPLFSSPNASPHTGARHGRGRPSACPA